MAIIELSVNECKRVRANPKLGFASICRDFTGYREWYIDGKGNEWQIAVNWNYQPIIGWKSTPVNWTYEDDWSYISKDMVRDIKSKTMRADTKYAQRYSSTFKFIVRDDKNLVRFFKGSLDDIRKMKSFCTRYLTKYPNKYLYVDSYSAYPTRINREIIEGEQRKLRNKRNYDELMGRFFKE